MPIQEREPFAAPWQPPHPFLPRACHPLSRLLGFCGLSTAIFVLYRKKGKEEEQCEGEEPRGKHGVASGEHGRIQASWLWVCEVLLLPTNSSLISQFQQIRIRWLHNSHRVDNCILCNHHLKHLEQGSPTSGPQTGPSRQISSSVRLEIKETINVMLESSRNHTSPPTPSPPPSMEIVFHEAGPWYQKI